MPRSQSFSLKLWAFAFWGFVNPVVLVVVVIGGSVLLDGAHDVRQYSFTVTVLL